MFRCYSFQRIFFPVKLSPPDSIHPNLLSNLLTQVHKWAVQVHTYFCPTPSPSSPRGSGERLKVSIHFFSHYAISLTTGRNPNLLSDSLTQLGHAIPHLFIMTILNSLLLRIMSLDNWPSYMGLDGRETFVCSVNIVLI